MPPKQTPTRDSDQLKPNGQQQLFPKIPPALNAKHIPIYPNKSYFPKSPNFKRKTYSHLLEQELFSKIPPTLNVKHTPILSNNSYLQNSPNFKRKTYSHLLKQELFPKIPQL